MPDPQLDFNFFAGGILYGILETLKTPLRAVGAKSFSTYSGELDNPEALKAAISQQTLTLPLVMATYAGGHHDNDPSESAAMGRPRTFSHTCGYGVIVVDNNPQGQKEQVAGGIFPMLSAVLMELTDVQLKTQVGDESVLLNIEPFEPAETIVIPKMPNMTVMCQMFDTAFEWESRDRTTIDPQVRRIHVEVGSLWPGHTTEPDTQVPPGVNTILD